MKKIILLLFFLIVLVACSKKDNETKYNGDNMNTPFVEISPNLQKKVEDAFHTEEICIGHSATTEATNYSIDERKKYSTINWQENMTNWENNKEYHFWFTCYYEKKGMITFHVERTLKDLEGGQKQCSETTYEIGGYIFKVKGPTLQNYAYILIYKNGKLFELGYAYDNSIIDDNDVKEIYKHYIDSKFLKYDFEYNNYKYDPENIPSE